MIEHSLAGMPGGYVWTELPIERLALFRRHLTDLVETLKADGQEVILCTHPSRFLLASDPKSELWAVAWRQYYPRATIAVMRQMEVLTNKEIRLVGLNLGAKVADLAKQSGWTPEMFSDFCHFTDKGAAKAAHILASVITSVGAHRGNIPIVM